VNVPAPGAGDDRTGSEDGAAGERPPTLAEEQQQLTRARIRKAAMVVLARRGFDATVEEIATVSGVSPRTIFRHYVSHDRLVAATVKDMFDVVGQGRTVELPKPGDDLSVWLEALPTEVADLDTWLDDLAVTVHTRIAEVFGEAFWDIHGPNSTATPALSDVADLRREYRRVGVSFLATLAWHKAGGRGDPPDTLVSAFALNLSAFATQALMIDFDCDPAEVGRLTADILRALVRRAVEAQQGGGAP